MKDELADAPQAKPDDQGGGTQQARSKGAPLKKSQERWYLLLGILMFWGMAAQSVKLHADGDSWLWAIFVSYAWVILLSFIAGVLLAVSEGLRGAVKQYGLYVVVLSIIPVISWFGAGSYNLTRDIVIALVAAFLVYGTGHSYWEKLISKYEMKPLRARIVSLGATAATWLILVWVATSVANIWLGPYWTPRDPLISKVSNSTTLPSDSKQKPTQARLGLALSGGGYRAALMHAGVLNALDELQRPIAGMATVSGGSIIGGAYAHGIQPVAFRDAVKEGRFNVKRDLVDIQNLVLLPCPMRLPLLDLKMLWFCDHSRTDAQAAMLDRVIFDDAPMANAPSPFASQPATLKQEGATRKNDHQPWWVVAGTDLISGDMIGVESTGLFRRSHAKPGDERGAGKLKRVYSPPEFHPVPKKSPLGKAHVSTIVAASGAFPGALSSVRLEIGAKNDGDEDKKPAAIQMADGGLTDNLGFSLLMSAHQWGVKHGHERLRLDTILVSDGGMPLRPEEEVGVYTDLLRAMDVVYASSGLDVDSPGMGPSTYWLSPQNVEITDFGDLPTAFVEQLKKQGINTPADARRYLERCKETFYDTSTLKDQFEAPFSYRVARFLAGTKNWAVGLFSEAPVEDTSTGPYEGEEAVDALYDLGRFLVYLHWSQIKPLLEHQAG